MSMTSRSRPHRKRRNLLDHMRAIGAMGFNNVTGFCGVPRVPGVELAVRL